MAIKRKAACINGHPYQEGSYYVYGDKHMCKVCTSARRKRYQDKTNFNAKYKSDLYFGGKRFDVLERDGNACVSCKITSEEHIKKYGSDLNIDHIDKMGTGVPRELRNNDISNLQTLCSVCHGRKDANRKLTEVQVINMRHMYPEVTARKLSEFYNVAETTVWGILKGRKWRGLL